MEKDRVDVPDKKSLRGGTGAGHVALLKQNSQSF